MSAFLYNICVDVVRCGVGCWCGRDNTIGNRIILYFELVWKIKFKNNILLLLLVSFKGSLRQRPIQQYNNTITEIGVPNSSNEVF